MFIPRRRFAMAGEIVEGVQNPPFNLEREVSRATKNLFGSCIGVFVLNEKGLARVVNEVVGRMEGINTPIHPSRPYRVMVVDHSSAIAHTGGVYREVMMKGSEEDRAFYLVNRVTGEPETINPVEGTLKIEDGGAYCETFLKALRGDSNYTLALAPEGLEEAIEILSKNPVDSLFLGSHIKTARSTYPTSQAVNKLIGYVASAHPQTNVTLMVPMKDVMPFPDELRRNPLGGKVNIMRKPFDTEDLYNHLENIRGGTLYRRKG